MSNIPLNTNLPFKLGFPEPTDMNFNTAKVVANLTEALVNDANMVYQIDFDHAKQTITGVHIKNRVPDPIKDTADLGWTNAGVVNESVARSAYLNLQKAMQRESIDAGTLHVFVVVVEPPSVDEV